MSGEDLARQRPLLPMESDSGEKPQPVNETPQLAASNADPAADSAVVPAAAPTEHKDPSYFTVNIELPSGSGNNTVQMKVGRSLIDASINAMPLPDWTNRHTARHPTISH